MSRFYGTIQGTRGEATRCGDKASGMETYCASWDGAIRCKAFVSKHCEVCGKSKYDHDLKMKACADHKYQETEEDWVRVEKTTWHGNGEYKLLYEGVIGNKKTRKVMD